MIMQSIYIDALDTDMAFQNAVDAVAALDIAEDIYYHLKEALGGGNGFNWVQIATKKYERIEKKREIERNKNHGKL